MFNPRATLAGVLPSASRLPVETGVTPHRRGWGGGGVGQEIGPLPASRGCRPWHNQEEEAIPSERTFREQTRMALSEGKVGIPGRQVPPGHRDSSANSPAARVFRSLWVKGLGGSSAGRDRPGRLPGPGTSSSSSSSGTSQPNPPTRWHRPRDSCGGGDQAAPRPPRGTSPRGATLGPAGPQFSVSASFLFL